MTEIIEMKPIPYRHMSSYILSWVYEQYPQLENKIVDMRFTDEGLVLTYKN